ncbi:MAG: BLUF domain-containing protein [Phycisphaerales bacterium]
MRVFQHLYVSHAASAFTEDDLAAISAECADGYRQVGMTGMMLYGCGVFVELLEGDPHYVAYMMDSIKSDARHTDFTTIIEGPASKRAFQDWTMHVLNTSPIGRDFVMTDAACLRRYLAFTPENDICKRTLAGLKYFRERVSELPGDSAAHEAFFAKGGQAPPPKPKDEPANDESADADTRAA